jgi:hypothetical protein
MKTTKADQWFSRFIRLRDADENGFGRCCTCGTIKQVKYMDCGHFIGRQHMATRFNEMNAHVQCKKCNGFEEGKKVQYKDFIVQRYGENQYNLLLHNARNFKKFAEHELTAIEKNYEAETERLLIEKGLEGWW